uniref:lactonase family protein n=1 Tax=uncultured Draconibacterium sp. TaxID=1573823 RepID=UPI0032172ECC
MKQYILILIALLFSSVVLSQSKSQQTFYVGTFTSEGAEGFYLCSFNMESGDVELTKVFKGSDNPNYLCLSPDKKYLYVVTRVPVEVEKTGGYVCAYKVVENGNLEFLNKQASNGNDPCYVDVSPDGKFVAIATYGGGTTSLFPVNSDGSLQEPASIIINKGLSADKSRQQVPHAHSIRFSPFGNEVFSADLGTDLLNIYKLENGELISPNQNFVGMEAGAGPRHFEFHPNGKVIYVINELNSTITAIQKGKEKWNVFQNISTLPRDYSDKSYCADIHISADGKYLYGSNRGHNSIAVFEVNSKDQTLESVGTVSVEGNWPRNFRITPDGNWMLVANQKSNDITVFKINKSNGIPEFTGKKIELPSPVCIEFL